MLIYKEIKKLPHNKWYEIQNSTGKSVLLTSEECIPKQEIENKIKELRNKQEEMTRKKHNADNINDCYLYGDEAQKAMNQEEVLEKLLNK